VTSAVAQQAPAPADDNELPQLSPYRSLDGYLNQPLAGVVLSLRGAVATHPSRTAAEKPLKFPWLQPGTTLTADLVRRVMKELLATGEYAEMSAEVQRLPAGVRLCIVALPRKVIGEVVVRGGVLPLSETLEVAGVSGGDDITEPQVQRVAAGVWQYYQRRGYPQAQVAGRLLSAEVASRVTLELSISPGPAERVSQRRFQLSVPAHESIQPELQTYSVNVSQRADGMALEEADAALQARLRRAGWFAAEVGHRLEPRGSEAALVIAVSPGRLTRVRFEGHRTFDAALLVSELQLETAQDLTSSALIERLRSFYAARGFHDASFQLRELGTPTRLDWLIVIREQSQLSVVGRWYPCLTGERTAEGIDAELDGFVGESLPGGDEVFAPANPKIIDRSLGSVQPGSPRVTPFVEKPWHVYTPEVYEKGLAHLADLYRSEGYLSAVVGPAVVMRRRCETLTQPGVCRPVGERLQPPSVCTTHENAIPVEDPAAAGATCVPDPTKGIRCEPTAVLSIPVKVGPRTLLWDVQFEGNTRLVESQLANTAALQLGAPVSQVELQKARRRLLDLYGDRGFAFASVDVDLDLSDDHTRGRVRFVISEREPVYVKGFVVRGANHTSHGVILGRLELTQGGLYARGLVRQSEEQVATLGVFSSVTIGLEDPEVPAREKVVIITVSQQPAQYLEVKPGFSTGEGARIAFEYGHRDLFDRAVQLRFRARLGYLPSFLIFEDEVRRDFDALTTGERLERSNTVTLEFPVAKRYRLALDGVDARDNSRDYGITKRAAIATLTHRRSEAVSGLVASSLESNNATIFGATESLQQFLEANPQLVRLLNIPEGESFAVAVRAGASWDRRDSQLGPTRGTLVVAEVEPVVAFLSNDNAAIQLSRCEAEDAAACEFKSRFIKFSSRVAGYIPFDDHGLSLALSLRWGMNYQLGDNSATYPDRLFFFGGGDSLRGFLEASVIPQDIADRLQPDNPNAPDQADRLTARKVVIRGGDFILNPRAELRIPLTKVLQTAIFLDTGNIWREVDNVNPFVLRYSAGTGLRAMTPIGPLALDYGFKLDRRFYEEAVGAFHFSVGLF
jgi:outer membrane protein assembly factor BamA